MAGKLGQNLLDNCCSSRGKHRYGDTALRTARVQILDNGYTGKLHDILAASATDRDTGGKIVIANILWLVPHRDTSRACRSLGQGRRPRCMQYWIASSADVRAAASEANKNVK